MRLAVVSQQRTASTSMKFFFQGLMMGYVPRCHWGPKAGYNRPKGDRVDFEPTHIITVVRDPLDRLLSLLSYRIQEIDWEANDDFVKMMKEVWGCDMYGAPFVEPFTAVGKLGIIKFEFLEDGVTKACEWLGKPRKHRITKANASRRQKWDLPDEKLRKLYGEYAKHFGYRYEPQRQSGRRL